MKKKIAIIGSGIAGLSAAYFLNKKYDISIFEQNNYLGGHVNTIEVNNNMFSSAIVQGSTSKIPVDTGFMVFNHINYPNLVKLFSKFDLDVVDTIMSLGIFDVGNGFEYMGNNIATIFSKKINLIRPAFLKMLWEVRKFHKHSTHIIENPQKYSMTVKEFVIDYKYSYYFIWYYLLPFISAVWSTSPFQMMLFPIFHLVKFLQNHGLLDYPRMYDWKTIKRGSKTYVQQLLKKINAKISINNPVMEIRELNNSFKQVELFFKDTSSKIFDKVIVATHADKALAMIKHPNNDHQRLLSKFTYKKNETYLHTDNSAMPKLKKNWASWNVGMDLTNLDQPKFMTSYYMNELQHLDNKQDYFVTLNPINPIQEQRIIKTMEYRHPIFSISALNAQKELPLLNNQKKSLQNVFFCGSYFGYGFHEDALVSSLQLSEQILDGKVEWY